MIIQMLDDELIKNLFFYAYTFHNDTSGKEHLTIEFARAKSSSDSNSDVTIRGIRSREKQGAMINNKKFGYTQKREHKNPKLCSLFPIPDGEKFTMVKKMFVLALEGYSSDRIAEMLRKEFPDICLAGVSWADKKLRDSFYC